MEYVNDKFIPAMSASIIDILKKDDDAASVAVELSWWPLAFDTVFSKFKSEELVSRLLSRTSLCHAQPCKCNIQGAYLTILCY